jgi:hypothetical protein
MTRGLAKRMDRLERAEEAADLMKLCTTERPVHLPAAPVEDWDADAMAQLRGFVAAAKAAGVKRALAWMGVADLEALAARAGVAGYGGQAA